MDTADFSVIGILGRCGDREVFVAFAAAKHLVRLSFADIYHDATNQGYQRPFNKEHSLGFKRYITQEGSTTIPLTFNLRVDRKADWHIERHANGQATLVLRGNVTPVMSQVDCQHRLGYLGDSDVPFAFMTYVGLTVNEEIAIFRDINGKSKGLSSSLLDSTEAQLAGELLPQTNPELYFAMQLSELPRSPWKGRLNKGGKATLGMTRAANLRTMNNAIRRFFVELPEERSQPHSETTALFIAFWDAIVLVLPEVWNNPRKHMLTKGVGVYALFGIAADLVREARAAQRVCDLDFFVEKLSDFLHLLDWSSDGALKGYGGAPGAKAAQEVLRHTRANSIKTLKTHGKQKNTAH